MNVRADFGEGLYFDFPAVLTGEMRRDAYGRLTAVEVSVRGSVAFLVSPDRLYWADGVRLTRLEREAALIFAVLGPLPETYLLTVDGTELRPIAVYPAEADGRRKLECWDLASGRSVFVYVESVLLPR